MIQSIYTSTISTEPACSKSPASCALSTLNGRLPTKSFMSSENSAPFSCSAFSVSYSDDTATATGAKNRPCGAAASSDDASATRSGSGSLQGSEVFLGEDEEMKQGEREAEKRADAMTSRMG
jgi:hypothetical protein